jgi:hypothetical protein
LEFLAQGFLFVSQSLIPVGLLMTPLTVLAWGRALEHLASRRVPGPVGQ